jgi:hypothetical protein
MDRLRGALTQKVGPLPAYAWAVLILGAYLAYSYVTKTGFFAPKTTPTDSTGGGGALPFGDGSGGGLPPTGGPGSTGTTGDNVVNPVPSYYSPSDGGFTPNAGAAGLPLTGAVDFGSWNDPAIANYLNRPAAAPTTSGFGPALSGFIQNIGSYAAPRGNTPIPEPTPGQSGGGRFLGGHGAQ